MARLPRYHDPEAVYHIMARGNGGQEIVGGFLELRRLLEVIAKVKESSDFKLYAYCLMSNHFHMLIRVGADPLSHFMHRIQSSWAKRFNLARNRRGHVFQDRFKSKHCGNDTQYVRWLLRYIHINPVNAGLVQSPENWAWSSYRQYIAARDGLADIDWPLSLFENRVSSFAQFVLQGIGDSEQPEPLRDSRADDTTCLDHPPADPNFADLAASVAQEFDAPVERLFRPTHDSRLSAARRRLALQAITAGFRAAFIARKFGVSRSAITKMLGRGE